MRLRSGIRQSGLDAGWLAGKQSGQIIYTRVCNKVHLYFTQMAGKIKEVQAAIGKERVLQCYVFSLIPEGILLCLLGIIEFF